MKYYLSLTTIHFSIKANLFKLLQQERNVIGGGDWSQNRLIPDIMKSLNKNKKLMIRNINSTRPWQHVFRTIIWLYSPCF